MQISSAKTESSVLEHLASEPLQLALGLATGKSADLWRYVPELPDRIGLSGDQPP